MRFLSIPLLWAILSGSAIGDGSLFSDQRAFQVNDIITIRVVESASADQSSNTASNKSASFKTNGSPGTGPLSSIPLFGVSGSADNAFDGSGETSRSGKLTANITARVTEVSNNGNLIVQGSRVVIINQAEEVMEIEGIVRPKDISADNSVLSTFLADARISYRGTGALDTSSRQGLISRFLGWIF